MILDAVPLTAGDTTGGAEAVSGLGMMGFAGLADVRGAVLGARAAVLPAAADAAPTTRPLATLLTPPTTVAVLAVGLLVAPGTVAAPVAGLPLAPPAAEAPPAVTAEGSRAASGTRRS